MIRVGIIGCGRITQRRHAPECAADKHAVVAGFYDRTAEKAEAMVQLYGGKVYVTVEEMFEDPQIDAISICSANITHADYAVRALKAGKHVLCEKPMAMTAADAQKMVDAAKEADRLLMIAQNQRYTPGHVRAKELLQEGIIGDVLTFETSFCHAGPESWIGKVDAETKEYSKDISFFDKKATVNGAMADLGIHKIDVIQFLFDQKITEVTAKVMTLDKRDEAGNLLDLEDNAFCIFRLENGITGTMKAGWTNYGEEDNSTAIFGTRGNLRIYDQSGHTIQVSCKNGDHFAYDLDEMMTNQKQTESGVIQEFLREIENGEWKNAADALAVNAIAAIEAAFRSSDEGRTINFQ